MRAWSGASGPVPGGDNVRAASDRPHSRVKRRWLDLLKAGAGSLVVAAAVMSAPPADAAAPDANAPLAVRVREARESLSPGPPTVDAADSLDEIAWWGNHWGNGGWGWHPWWHNWPNWHNWHNWGNW